MQVAKRVPFDDPNVLNAVRGIYLLSNLIIAGIYYAIHLKINKKKGMRFSNFRDFRISFS
jgi:hypothetical protein